MSHTREESKENLKKKSAAIPGAIKLKKELDDVKLTGDDVVLEKARKAFFDYLSEHDISDGGGNIESFT